MKTRSTAIELEASSFVDETSDKAEIARSVAEAEALLITSNARRVSIDGSQNFGRTSILLRRPITLHSHARR